MYKKDLFECNNAFFDRIILNLLSRGLYVELLQSLFQQKRRGFPIESNRTFHTEKNQLVFCRSAIHIISEQ